MLPTCECLDKQIDLRYQNMFEIPDLHLWPDLQSLLLDGNFISRIPGTIISNSQYSWTLPFVFMDHCSARIRLMTLSQRIIL